MIGPAQKLVVAYDEYIKHLEDAYNSLIGLHVVHGFRGDNELYERGVNCRAKIAELKKKVL